MEVKVAALLQNCIFFLEYMKFSFVMCFSRKIKLQLLLTFILTLHVQVLGPSHPKTGRARDTLNEATYVRIREQRERQAAGTA